MLNIARSTAHCTSDGQPSLAPHVRMLVSLENCLNLRRYTVIAGQVRVTRVIEFSSSVNDAALFQPPKADTYNGQCVVSDASEAGSDFGL